MLLVIRNLPNNIRYLEIKSLIEEKCGSVQVILDNLVNEGKFKRVTVGLADEGDAALLVRKINGLYLNGCQLFVEDIRQKKASEQPFRPAIPPTFEQRAEKMPHYENPEPMQSSPQLAPAPSMSQMLSAPMPYSNLPFYMSPVQNSYTNYENQVLISNNQMPQTNYEPGSSFNYQKSDVQNQWTQPMLTSYPENPHHTPRNISLGSTNRDSRWGEGSDDRNRSGQSQRDGSRFSPGANQERSDNRYSKYEMTGRNESGDRSRRPHRSSPQRHDFAENRGNRRDNDNFQRRQSRFDRSPPKDRPIDSRNRRAREESREFDQYDQDRDSGRNEKRRGDDKREQEHTFDQRDHRGGSDRFDKSRDNDRYTQPREYDQRQTEQTQSLNQSANQYDQPSGYGMHGNNQGYYQANKVYEQKPFVSKYALRNNTTKRPYSNVSQGPNPTYGNNPNNPSFSNSNKNNFDKGTNFSGFNRNFSPKQPRFENDTNKVGPKVGVVNPKPTAKPKPTPTPKSESLPLQKLLVRHTGWRHQLAASFAKEMMEKLQPQTNVASGILYKKLKEGIVSRIDVILGDNIAKSLVEMKVRYRARFQSKDDITFFHAVMEKIEEEKNKRVSKQTDEENQVKPGDGEANPNVTEKPKENVPTTSEIPAPEVTKPTNQYLLPIPITTSITPNQPKPTALQPMKKTLPQTAPFQAPATDTQYIIKAPEYGLHTIKSLQRPTYKRKGSKFTKQKKLQKQEYHLENLFDVYDMESPYKEIVDDEINELVKVFTARDDKFLDAHEEKIFDRIVKEITPNFKRVAKLNLVKRVLDIKTGLLIRVFPSPKFPKRASLDQFMKIHGVTSFKKSSTMFVAVCDSYKSYDKLIRMGSARLDDTEITFKTMHVTGPRKSVREKMKDKAKAKAAAKDNQQIGRDDDDDFFHDDNEQLGESFDFDNNAGNFGDTAEGYNAGNFGDTAEGYNAAYDDAALENDKNDKVLTEEDAAGRNQLETTQICGSELTEDNVKESTENNSQQITETDEHNVAEYRDTAEILQDNEQSGENVQPLEATAGIEEDDLEDF